MEPRDDEFSIDDDPRRPPRRRTSALPFVLGAAFLIAAAIAGIRMIRSATSLLSEVELRIEGGPKRFLGRGERVRLALTLARPAAVIVYLQDPEGAIEEVYPPPGDVQLLSGTAVLPGRAADAWETAGLDPGNYFLWMVASPEPIPAADRADLEKRIAGTVRDVPREEKNLYVPLRRVLEALRPRIEEVAVRNFLIHPR